MKRIIIALLLACFLFVSCIDMNRCRNSVQATFPNGEVYHIVETPYFLVLDSVGVYIVACNTPFSYGIHTNVLVKKWNYENRN